MGWHNLFIQSLGLHTGPEEDEEEEEEVCVCLYVCALRRRCLKVS